MPKKSTLTFEEATARLAEIVNKLDKGDASLEESLALFTEGAELTQKCQKLLKNAERKMQTLTQESVDSADPTA